MAQNQTDFDTLMQQAEAMPYGPEKLAVLEQAVALADAQKAVSLGVNARFDLIETIMVIGQAERGIQAFDWCLARYDEDKDALDAWQVYDLFWIYKWVLVSARQNPQTSYAHVQALHDDLEKRYYKAGNSPSTAQCYLMLWAMHRGDVEAAARAFSLWQSHPRDNLSDCLACEINHHVMFEILRGNYETALEVAAPLLAGEHSCNIVPRRTYAVLLVPLMKLGRWQQAAEFFEKGWQLEQAEDADARLLDFVAYYLFYLVMVGDYAQALELFQDDVARALSTPDLLDKYEFYVASYALFASLERNNAHNIDDIGLDLPKNHALYQPANIYSIHTLTTFFAENSRELAQRFDKRNQSDAFMQNIADKEAMLHSRQDQDV